MRALIAIGSWENAAYLGYNQSQRDTFLKELTKFPGIEHKFFFGDHNPTGEDESQLNALYDDVCVRYHGSRYDYIKPPVKFQPQEHEIVLNNLPDDHRHNSFKTKKALEWGLAQQYEHIFVCGVDTLIDIERLVNSGFEKHHYTGTDQWNPNFAGGGPGYWLSAEAAMHVVSSPVMIPRRTFENGDLIWAEGTWVGGVMGDAGIKLHPDRRYTEWPQQPLSTNDFITSHLGVPTPEEPVYRAQRMLDCYRKRTDS